MEKKYFDKMLREFNCTVEYRGTNQGVYVMLKKVHDHGYDEGVKVGYVKGVDDSLWAVSDIESMSSLNITPSKMYMPKSFRMKFVKIYKALKKLKSIGVK